MPTWSQVEARYGRNMAKVMKKCPYLCGITVCMLPDGEIEIPEHDIDIAYRWARGEEIGIEEWD